MRDLVFERDVKEAMVDLAPIVSTDPEACLRMARAIAAQALYVCGEAFSERIRGVADACAVALGGEEITVHAPEVPAYRAHLPWDPWGLAVDLEAYRRMGVRYGVMTPEVQESISALVRGREVA